MKNYKNLGFLFFSLAGFTAALNLLFHHNTVQLILLGSALSFVVISAIFYLVGFSSKN